MTPKALTVRPVVQHAEPKPHTYGAYVWKCRACPNTRPDEINLTRAVCTCGEVMDLTPVKKEYHGNA